ncbi:phasin family protein [Henriciella aquimarina]|uniref:phasin family protein n=1 Tax=Henriciella aquimarina TaxID=545261 RepID=UPI000A011144|nr:phasin family protein [Henriciella aquimarina]
MAKTEPNMFGAFNPETFVKAFPFANQFGDMGKDAMNASTESAKASVKSFQDASAAMMRQAQDRMSMTVETGKTLAGAKTVEEAMEIQSDYMKTAFKAHMDGLNELAGIYSTAMKDCLEPFAGYTKDVMAETKKATAKAKAAAS